MTEIDTDPAVDSTRQRFVVLAVGQSPADALATVESDVNLMVDAASKGAVWVKRRKPNGQMAKLVRLRNLDEPVLDGSELFVNINEEVLQHKVDPPSLLQEEKNYSFWFKPRGVLSQGSKWGDHTSMPYLVNQALNRPAHLVHRLDRFACGVMVLGHTKPAVKALTAVFAKRKVIKRYQVVVDGEFNVPLPHQCSAPIDDAQALTVVESMEHLKARNQSELSIQLHTGRKHQIRRHLAELNFPVVGDKRYGNGSDQTELALMATELEFQCPFTEAHIHCVVPTTLQKNLYL